MNWLKEKLRRWLFPAWDDAPAPAAADMHLLEHGMRVLVVYHVPAYVLSMTEEKREEEFATTHQCLKAAFDGAFIALKPIYCTPGELPPERTFEITVLYRDDEEDCTEETL